MSFKQGLWLVIESASVFMAIVVFIVGMDWVANDEPYTGGIYAPLMALCAALLLLLNSVDVDASKRQAESVSRRVRRYIRWNQCLFLDRRRDRKRPTDPDVWLGFSLAWYLVFAYVVLATLMIAAILANKDE